MFSEDRKRTQCPSVIRLPVVAIGLMCLGYRHRAGPRSNSYGSAKCIDSRGIYYAPSRRRGVSLGDRPMLQP